MASGPDAPARSRCAARLRLRCELCDATLLSQHQLDQHLAGRRHRERLRDHGLSAEDLHARAERNLRNLVLGERNAGKAGRDLVAEIQAFVRRDATPGSGRILLYYKYTDVVDPDSARQWQLDLCTALHLRGRIHVATEGVNGTVGGSVAATALYIAAMEHHTRWASVFSGIDYKQSEGDASAFPNLFVKSCDEIIALGCSTSEISWRDCAEHLEPAEFHKLLLKHAAQQSRAASAATDVSGAGCSDSDAAQGRGDLRDAQPSVSDDSVPAELAPAGGSLARPKAADTGLETGSDMEMDSSSLVLLDCRNLYESEIGRFDGAIRCPTRHFTEFPAVADRMVEDMQLRDKTVLMYCTGGIRCERASAYLRSVGVRRCFQLKGGIAKYCEAFPAAEPAAAAAVTACLDPSNSGNADRASHAQPAAREQIESEDSCTPGSSSQTAPGMRNISMFRGKNFVFDRRMALQAGRPGDIVGECVLCRAAWDQYDREVACEQCSALVLVCVACRPNVFVGSGPNQPTVRRKRKQADRSSSDSNCTRFDDNVSGTDLILCTYCRSGSPASR